MRKQTQVTLYLNTLTVSENLTVDPQGFILKAFMSCSGKESRVFKVHSNIVKINQTIKIKNIYAKELQFWLCNTYNKIIATGSINLGTEDGNFELDLKMMTTNFAKLEGNLQIRQYEIEKKVVVEPDEELLKKVEDPIEKRRKQQQQQKKGEQAAEALEAAKNVKKPAVTLTRFNKKDEPFV